MGVQVLGEGQEVLLSRVIVGFGLDRVAALRHDCLEDLYCVGSEGVVWVEDGEVFYFFFVHYVFEQGGDLVAVGVYCLECLLVGFDFFVCLG